MAKKTILIVDDDHGIGKMLGLSIEMLGCAPIICTDGEAAILHIKSVDILITDFNMPGMNGVELTKLVKQQNPGIPVIIMTGTPLDIPSDHLADQVIEKPFGFEQLKKVIADLLK